MAPALATHPSPLAGLSPPASHGQHLHLSFSSSVPREVTDSAWMNSENSILPSWGRKGGVKVLLPLLSS